MVSAGARRPSAAKFHYHLNIFSFNESGLFNSLWRNERVSRDPGFSFRFTQPSSPSLKTPRRRGAGEIVQFADSKRSVCFQTIKIVLGLEPQCTAGTGNWSATVLSDPSDIRRLKPGADGLNPDGEPELDPEFFLSSVVKGWRARVVAVSRGGRLEGILFGKERVISGVPTGVVYADGSLGGLLLANPFYERRVLRAAVEQLLACPGIRGVRLRVPLVAGEPRVVPDLLGLKSIDMHSVPVEYNQSRYWKQHAHLSLPATYQQFLERLGSTTRHNFRYYRKRFESAGHRFVDSLSTNDLLSAALSLQPNAKFMSDSPAARVKQSCEMVSAAQRGFAVGLRHRDGRWMSVIGGWYRPGAGVLCFQCNNDNDFGSHSLSVVLRAYLIEKLIKQGLGELVIWSDTAPPLSRYASYTPTVAVHLDAATTTWRLARRVLSTVGPHLPKRWASAALWVY